MKHFGCTFEYERERDDDFMDVYHNLIKDKKHIVLSDIFNKLVMMPSKRFWVSEERAAIVVTSMMRGAKLDKMRSQKREMFREIYKRVRHLLREEPQLTIAAAVSRVVHEPAPKFYMTPESARIIFYRIKKKWYIRKMQKLQHWLQY